MNIATEIVVNPIDTLEGAPEGPGAEPVADADWVTLTRFEVQVNQRSKIIAPVYANGRQQVPVEIIIQARDKDGVEVSLSDAQMRTIRLINYNTGTAVVGCRHDKDARFIYYWPLGKDDDGEGNPDEDVPADTPGATAQAIMIYVHTTAVSTSRIAAEIESPSGGVFRTNTSNPPAGKFDSWVDIRGEEELRYRHTDLVMERENEVTTSHWDIDLYYIRFATQAFNIVQSIHLDMPGGTPHLSKTASHNRKVHVAFSAGIRTTVNLVGGHGIPGVSFDINKRAGQATAARWTTRLVHYSERRSEACVRYYNQYGNYAECALGNSYEDDYNMLSLGQAWH